MSTGVKFPFTIQSGSVAVTDDTIEAVRSQVAFCLGTLFGERVMRPTWGVDLLSTVWSIGGELDLAMREGIDNAFKAWFPDYEPRTISISRDPDLPTYVEIYVTFGRHDSDLDMTARVGTQLPGGTEIQTNEGF